MSKRNTDSERRAAHGASAENNSAQPQALFREISTTWPGLRILMVVLMLSIVTFGGSPLFFCTVFSWEAGRAHQAIQPGMTAEEVIRAAPAPSYWGNVCQDDGTESSFHGFFGIVSIGSRDGSSYVESGDNAAEFASGRRFCGTLRISFFSCLTPCGSSFEVVFDEEGLVRDKTPPRIRL